eukprot:3902420-Heterocapsa_arctica.AAC.1
MGLAVAAISPYFRPLQSVLQLIDPMMLLMDSGAFAHVCPPSFMLGVPLREIAKPPYVTAATGK